MRGFRLSAVLLLTLLLAAAAFAAPTPESFTFETPGNIYVGADAYPHAAAGSRDYQNSHSLLLADDYADRILTGKDWPTRHYHLAGYAIWALFTPSTAGAWPTRSAFPTPGAAPDAAEMFNYPTVSGNAGLISWADGQGSSSWQSPYTDVASFNVSTPIPGMGGVHPNMRESVSDSPQWKKVPEPTTLTLMGTGLVALAVMLRRKLLAAS
jgi:hypothetical protein